MSRACFAASIIPGVHKIKKKVAVVGSINGTQHILHLELRLRIPCSLAPAKISTHNNPHTYKLDTSVATFPFITSYFSCVLLPVILFPQAEMASSSTQPYLQHVLCARACASTSLSFSRSFFLALFLSLSHSLFLILSFSLSLSRARAVFSLPPTHFLSLSLSPPIVFLSLALPFYHLLFNLFQALNTLSRPSKLKPVNAAGKNQRGRTWHVCCPRERAHCV